MQNKLQYRNVNTGEVMTEKEFSYYVDEEAEKVYNEKHPDGWEALPEKDKDIRCQVAFEVALHNCWKQEKVQIKDSILDFITINVDGEKREWSFESIKELEEMWFEEDYSGPGDDPVTEMKFYGVPMYVKTFTDIINLFGIKKGMKTDDKTEIEKLWDDLHARFPGDRDKWTDEVERRYVAECFDIYEKEGFAKKFWSPYSDVDEEEYFGKPFTVTGRCTEEQNDLEVLPMWNVRFGDGHEICCGPEEIIPSEMKANGCCLNDID